LIEPFGAGGGPDLLARALASRLAGLWAQSVTVENHPGAGSTAAPALVAASPPDGYTLLINTSAQAYSAAVLAHLPYDPLKDFAPLAPLPRQPYVLVTGETAGLQSVGQLIVPGSIPGRLTHSSA
jgi:tripartite-type tricarboxylate transporter receptor subunit TctC